MHAWENRVTAEVPVAKDLDASILAGALPLIHETLAEALSGGDAMVVGGSTLGAAHGRERALMTGYRPCDLIHELQIFRDVILDTAELGGVRFSQDQRALVRCLTDGIARDSLNGHSQVREQERKQFSAALSRDVRNLLNVVGVTAQLIGQKAHDPGIASMTARITGKIGEADAMLQNVTNEASLTRTLKLKLTIGQVSLFPLIEQVRIDFQDAPPAIRIRSDRIEGYWSWATMDSALRDLVILARQFGAPTGEIVIAAKVDFGRLFLSVHDASFFLGADEIGALFGNPDRYGDGDAARTGLSSVREVAESHGGSLVVRSSASSGTTFTINIPLDARPYVQ
ncbi:hypothetical protein GJV26_02920 [Massilia dura]|uniref:histidine kinase n=1 Tax=Pseudoduganella dura TaxID=321982 RepID=A0A6I3XIC7_9BURK|nr:HAMP domain-containing sensor histidine kinase [Pseudoduganella dura]MUI11445.1 hypothetical protein [Pseudoduganella dura]GGX97685.1 hypothetical protein GCM10007386_30850 [Pseudoduganella dura]